VTTGDHGDGSCGPELIIYDQENRPPVPTLDLYHVIGRGLLFHLAKKDQGDGSCGPKLTKYDQENRPQGFTGQFS
jgi:hypothetical protein